MEVVGPLGASVGSEHFIRGITQQRPAGQILLIQRHGRTPTPVTGNREQGIHLETDICRKQKGDFQRRTLLRPSGIRPIRFHFGRETWWLEKIQVESPL
jgi:hypothetical protein